MKSHRLVVGISGASGALYAVRLLHWLRTVPEIETHLVVSGTGYLNIQHELGLSRADIEPMADVYYPIHDLGAKIASGSFQTMGMVIVPCSTRTLGAVAHGISDNLLCRAAEVTLKERRRLVMLVREAPLHLAHLRNMTQITEMGGVIFPPVPAMYQRPKTLQDMVDDTVCHVLQSLNITVNRAFEWQGL